jgi:CheY-like chemotaxis protein/anti-sigma regulatory factor (Ser/Thr protein kinase)
VARPLKILVVDDTPSNAKQLEVVARKLGHETIFAEDGLVAIERYQSESPDLIFMDIMMPRMDGINAAERIRALPSDRWVPIVFFSALDSVQDIIQGLEKGGDDYLTKPANLSLMRAKINGYARVLEMQDSLRQQASELLDWRNEAEEQSRLGHHVISRLVDAEGLNDPLLQWFNIPATTFSGDLICAARGPDGVLYLMLADAAGHGLAAALTALPLTQVFYGMVAKGFPLTSLTQELNRKLKAILPADRFVAAILATIDIDHRILEVWNGGLPDALFIDANGQLVKRWQSRHPPLGVMPPAYFSPTTETHHFHEAGELVVYSDGLVELDTGAGNRMDMDLLESTLRGASPGKSMAAIRQHVDTYLQGGAGHDDISCAIVAVPIEEHKSLPIAAARGSAQGPVSEWRLELSWSAQELREIDVVPTVLGLTGQIRALKSHQAVLFLVLSELFNNALDHGLLGLDSSRKDVEGGFEDYLAQRADRLTNLKHGNIDISLLLHMADGVAALDISLVDSGPGFDFNRYIEAQSNARDDNLYHGRGISLVRQLCAEVAYSGSGNRVWARYQL